MSEYRFEFGVFKAGGSIWPKISGRRGRPPSPVLHVAKLGTSTFHMV